VAEGNTCRGQEPKRETGGQKCKFKKAQTQRAGARAEVGGLEQAEVRGQKGRGQKAKTEWGKKRQI
jgi:hypothetical protein